MSCVRRTLDFLLAVFGLLLLAPFLFLAGLLIALENGFPIVFVQERIGRGGAKFKMLKLRTMKKAPGAAITVGRDPRITRVGAFLRKLKMDEFPQLINVLKGEMTFVGPRPEVDKYVQKYSADQRKVLDLTPGITDPASLKYYNESEVLAEQSNPEEFYILSVMPDKIQINLSYAQSRSFCSDMKVILATLLRVVGVTGPSQQIVARLSR